MGYIIAPLYGNSSATLARPHLDAVIIGLSPSVLNSITASSDAFFALAFCDSVSSLAQALAHQDLHSTTTLLIY